jgi:hypothetical protein
VRSRNAYDVKAEIAVHQTIDPLLRSSRLRASQYVAEVKSSLRRNYVTISNSSDFLRGVISSSIA